MEKIIKIENWLKKYNIKEYTINKDFTIDARIVLLMGYPEKELPEYIQFNNVFSFNISNSNLTSLKGCPYICWSFFIKNCNNLKTLKYGPKTCLKIFDCTNCNNLVSLEGAPKECEYFNCCKCSKLESLKGCPKKCDEFICKECKKLSSLKGSPEKCKIFICADCNSLTSLEGAPKECEEFDCSFCKKLTSLEGCPNKLNKISCYGCKGNFTHYTLYKYDINVYQSNNAYTDTNIRKY